jgi:hypothetical protein
MASDIDEDFYARADAHIRLSNEQCAEMARGKVSASMMYATARFNSWVSACGFHSAQEMKAAREQMVAYFVDQYRKMLEDNLNDHIEHFDNYMMPDDVPKS